MMTGVMMQYFHWYSPNDGSLWNKLKEESQQLAELGVTAVWLPPAFKAAAGDNSVGYDVYDLYDLGEFDQKGTVRTKYGTKEEYLQAIKVANEAGIQVYADVVVNHLAGADESEKIKAIKVNPEDRNEEISEPYDIEAFTKFTHPGRKKTYSDFEWNFTCFSGTDFDALKEESGIFSIINEAGEGWEEMIADEKGNYDYLMYADIEFRNPAVREELKKWGKWYKETAGFQGVRLDAVKHISPKFYNEWLAFMRTTFGEEFFAVGEYWAPGDLPSLQKYIEATERKMSLFDASLHHNFHEASTKGSDFDLSSIFNETLTGTDPTLSVTVVDNHDTQPLQALEAPVQDWFKPLAYAFILLRTNGYPCIFYPDLYGAKYTDKGNDGNDHEVQLTPVAALPQLLQLRQTNCNGEFHDYLDHPNCVGWSWEGNKSGKGCVAVLSNGEPGFKKIYAGKHNAGKFFKDFLNNTEGKIKIDENGEAEFTCPAGSISVWCLES